MNRLRTTSISFGLVAGVLAVQAGTAVRIAPGRMEPDTRSQGRLADTAGLNAWSR